MSIGEKIWDFFFGRLKIAYQYAELRYENAKIMEELSGHEDLDEMVEDNRSALMKAGLWEALEERTKAEDSKVDEGFSRAGIQWKYEVTKEVAKTNEEKELIIEWFALNDARLTRERHRKNR